MIDIKDIVELSDNKEYVVCGKITYENKEYYYLVENKNMDNVIFGYIDNDEIVEVNYKVLIQKLIPLFADQSKKMLEEIK